VCTMRAPRDQRKSSNNQRRQAELAQCRRSATGRKINVHDNRQRANRLLAAAMQTVQIKRWVETHLVRVSANGSLAFPGITEVSANGIWQKACKGTKPFTPRLTTKSRSLCAVR